MATRRGKARFTVVVRSGGRDANDGPQTIGQYVKAAPAITRLTEVVQQWAASEGAIAPGTKVSVVDTTDGGELLSATYAGYEPATLQGGRDVWAGLAQRTGRRTWPR